MKMKRKVAEPSDDEVSDPDSVEENGDIRTNGKLKSKKMPHDRKKFKSGKLAKQATAEELNRLRETENLFSSNFFRLQIEEVVKEVAVKSKYVSHFNAWLEKFNDFLARMGDDESYPLTDQSWLNDSNVKAPSIQIPYETKGRFIFMTLRPAKVIGSHKFGLELGPVLDVDIKVEMPKEMFHKDDYLNDRYSRKRALCLAYLADKLMNSDLVEDMKYKLLNESITKPVLIFRPVGKSSKKISVTLHLCPEDGVFKPSRFSPIRNNVREDWRFETEDNSTNALIPTPFYNNTIAMDLAYEQNNDMLYTILAESENLKQGILLLKIWLKQRQIYNFSNHIITMFVAYLVRSRRINNAMSSYQIIRNVWTALASSDWDVNGISLCDSDATDKPSVQEFQTHFPIVFLDSTGYNNISSYLSIDVYNTVKYESQLAVQFLDNQNINSFHALFMTPVDFHMKYDHILKLDYTKKLESIVLEDSSENTKLDHGPDRFTFVQKYVCDTLRRGLSNRISLITPKCLSDSDREWPIDGNLKKCNPLRKSMLFGFKLNTENAFNLVDKGPEANLMEAEEFRKFWGSKSELRRFQDGSISEACVWETTSTHAARRLIVKRIIFYLLQVKLGIEKKLFYIADQFEGLLYSKKFQPSSFDYGTGEEAALKVNLALDSLTKNLRSVTEIPLEINSAQGTSSVFSYSDPIPPLAYTPPCTKGFVFSGKYRLISEELKNTKKQSEFRCPTFVPAMNVILSMSHSGKWPENLEALKRIKAAFYIQLSEALKQQCSLTCQPREWFLDVLKDGFVFRLEIGHQKEIALMKKVIDKDGIVKYKDTEESLDVECRLLQMPRLRVALNGLYHHHQAYGPACCLVKRWIRGHMIDDFHFPDICIDLIVAHVFMRPEPYEVPNQPQVAFWRALQLFAKTDWNAQMLLLNFNETIEKGDIIEIEANFNSMRSSLPPLYFVTPYEETKNSIWSKRGPSFQVLARVQMLGMKALNLIDNIILKEFSNEIIPLFKPSLDGYDVLIHIKKNLNPLSFTSIKNMAASSLPRQVKAYEKLENEFIPIVEFNPLKIYLDHLRSSYDDFAFFFHDTYGGDVIGVLWKPTAMDFKEFKTSIVNGRKVVEKNNKSGIVTDFDSILEGFLLLGEGLIENIENVTNKCL